MNLLLKIVGVGFVAVFLFLILKKDKPEIALVTSICGGVLILLVVASSIGEIVSLFSMISNKTQTSASFLKPLLKIVAIAYITEFCSSIAEDAGCKTIANKIVLGGKVVILLICVPVLKTLFELLLSVL